MVVETDCNGQLAVPHHDGDLIGVSVSGGMCRLRFRSMDKCEREICLKGVHALEVSSFREGNTILSMVLVPAERAADLVSRELLSGLGWGMAPRIKGKFLFVLYPSYGASVVADCEDVEVIDIGHC